MAIKLEKNKAISLKKADKGLEYLRVGLGWDAKILQEYKVEKKKLFGLVGTGEYEVKTREVNMDVDIDATILLYDDKKKPIGECSYRNLRATIGGKVLIQHSGDCQTGGIKGDDETIEMFLDNMLDTHVHYAYVVLNIYAPDINFDVIQNAYVNLYDNEYNTLANFNLTENYAGKNGVIAAKLVKHVDQSNNKSWEFVALGDGIEDAERIDFIVKRAINY